MILEPAATEIVYHISDEENRLKKHFNLYYAILAEASGEVEHRGGVSRYFSGSPASFQNAMIGCPEEAHWDRCITEQLHYFNEAHIPFVWYLDEQSNPGFKKELLKRGFRDGGVFRGVTGTLDKPIPSPEVPVGCVLELVKDESSMNAFNDLVCATFDIQGAAKKMYRQTMWDAAQQTMCHWVVKKEGKVVSALSTLIEGDMVSFWNGATLPEMRHQGLSSALRRFALRDAVSRGCRRGASYLMSEGLAFGICSKLGYQTKWRLNVFLSPVQERPN